MEPSNAPSTQNWFDLKNKTEDRLKTLTTYRKTLLPNDSNLSQVDKIIKTSLENLLRASYQIQKIYLNKPEELTLDSWTKIRTTAENRIDILSTFRVTLPRHDPYFSTLDKAIAEAKADVLESKITILKIEEQKAARLRFYNAEIQKTLRTYDYK